ncbi:MAG: SUMF1/EgtB/PvdO family nonheme iron enzyme [Spirochaetes bacterium]|nr:SUMF1/EgtB/PvdO family nonheme iron enzyme [Spirochaetota bacterium]
MAEEKHITQEDIDRAEVHLRPLAGIPPGTWVMVVFGFLVAAILFALIVLPGLAGYGTLASFSSDPSGAAVAVDGSYRASTPCEIFLPAGNHGLEVAYPRFTSKKWTENHGGRLLFSLFLPKRSSVEAELVLADPSGLLADAQAEFASWSLVGKPSPSYQFPMVLSDAAAARFADPAIQAPPTRERRMFLYAAARNALYPESARDALRAGALLYSWGASASPAGALAVADGLLDAVGVEPGVLSVLERSLPADKAAELRAMPLYSRTPRLSPNDAIRSGPVFPALAIGGVRFIAVPAGEHTFAPDGALTATLSVDGFGIAATETTRDQYSRFIKANPAWAPVGADSLRKAGLVDKGYLAGWNEPGAAGSLPVTGVSRAAALAYCAWLSGSAPAGYRVALPSEIQWEYAAVKGSASAGVFAASGSKGPSPAGSAGVDKLGIADLPGNVWEWCDDPFTHFPTVGAEAAGAFPAAEFVVRGGSWANPKGSVGVRDRGSFPAGFCSPFLGFRAVLVHAEP